MTQFELRLPRLTVDVPESLPVTREQTVELRPGDWVELRVAGVVDEQFCLAVPRTVQVVSIQRRAP